MTNDCEKKTRPINPNRIVIEGNHKFLAPCPEKDNSVSEILSSSFQNIESEFFETFSSVELDTANIEVEPIDPVSNVELSATANSTTFTTSNLTASGVFNFYHNLNSNAICISVYDNNNQLTFPSSVNVETENMCSVNLQAHLAYFTGTWRIDAIGGSTSNTIITVE